MVPPRAFGGGREGRYEATSWLVLQARCQRLSGRAWREMVIECGNRALGACWIWDRPGALHRCDDAARTCIKSCRFQPGFFVPTDFDALTEDSLHDEPGPLATSRWRGGNSARRGAEHRSAAPTAARPLPLLGLRPRHSAAGGIYRLTPDRPRSGPGSAHLQAH